MKIQNINLQSYHEQVNQWPVEGRHIMAQYDENSVIVYQAYRPAIGHFAAQHGYFGAEFSLTRMSWIKPNFLWMMYRSGWGTKPGQEVILAVRLQRSFFDALLTQAVPSTFNADLYQSQQRWQQAVKQSEVRLQWDPDHNPAGRRMQRRAIQLGLRGNVLASYAKSAILDITDISAFVSEQRNNIVDNDYSRLSTPKEDTYRPANTELFASLRLDTQ